MKSQVNPLTMCITMYQLFKTNHVLVKHLHVLASTFLLAKICVPIDYYLALMF